MTSFTVSVGEEDALAFANLSGDWNPLHSDVAYAAKTKYRKPVLHGAYSAGLVSRMAGMHLPGRECLLQSMRLRFVDPIIPPATLKVSAQLKSHTAEQGHVDVTITDEQTGRVYVDASYEYGLHTQAQSTEAVKPAARQAKREGIVVVTGASGGVGAALMKLLGAEAVGVSRSKRENLLCVPNLEDVGLALADHRIDTLVHCAWPKPDNQSLLLLTDSRAAVEANVAEPTRQIIALARLLAEKGNDDALLVLIGSTAAHAGRHNFRMPLYSLAKAMVPSLTQILALELAVHQKRCVSLVFDVIDAGINSGMSENARVSHADRSPFGRVPDAGEVASQIKWIMANRGFLLSGSTIHLTGGALP